MPEQPNPASLARELGRQTKPNQTPTKPNQSQPKPNQSQPKLNQTQAKPNQSQSKPNQTQPKPSQTQSTSNQTQSTSNQTQSKPNQTQPKPSRTQSTSNQSQSTSNQTQPKQNQTLAEPNQIRTHPDQNTQIQPQGSPRKIQAKPIKTQPKRITLLDPLKSSKQLTRLSKLSKKSNSLEHFENLSNSSRKLPELWNHQRALSSPSLTPKLSNLKFKRQSSWSWNSFRTLLDSSTEPVVGTTKPNHSVETDVFEKLTEESIKEITNKPIEPKAKSAHEALGALDQIEQANSTGQSLDIKKDFTTRSELGEEYSILSCYSTC